MTINNCFNCDSLVQGSTADYCLHTDLMIENPVCCAAHTAFVGFIEPMQQACAIYNPPQVFAGNPYACDPLQWQ